MRRSPGRLWRGGAEHERRYDGWHPLPPRHLKLGGVESRIAQCGDGVAVAVTALGEGHPRPVQTVLPTAQARLGSTNVLDQDEAASRSKDATDLCQRRCQGDAPVVAISR